MQAIVDACEDGRLDAEVRVVISNNSQAKVLKRAHRHGIPSYHLGSADFSESTVLDGVIRSRLARHGINLVVLGGYMKRLGPLVLSHYKGRILNTHPALLPKYGGQGMYGDNVHAAILEAGEKTSGATAHLVEGDYDMGRVISQVEVPVLDGDTVETLRDRVQAAEREHYVEVLQKITTGVIRLEGLVT